MNNVAVFVSSCDKYADLWDAFYGLFFEHWQQCPLPIYHVSDSKRFDHPRVTSLCPADAKRRYTWSGLTKWALQQIPEEHILFILEDYFFIRQVNAERLAGFYEVFRQENASYLRLTPNPSPRERYGRYEHVGVLPKGIPWRTSTQVAFWKKEELIRLLDESENAWEYERNSVGRADQTDGLYLSLMLDPKSPVLLRNYEKAYYPIVHLNATNMGKWDRETLRFCRRRKIALDEPKRPMETPWKGFYKRFYYKKSDAVDHALDFIQHRVIRHLFPNQLL
jgi:hypothetical protein